LGETPVFSRGGGGGAKKNSFFRPRLVLVRVPRAHTTGLGGGKGGGTGKGFSKTGGTRIQKRWGGGPCSGLLRFRSQKGWGSFGRQALCWGNLGKKKGVGIFAGGAVKREGFFFFKKGWFTEILPFWGRVKKGEKKKRFSCCIVSLEEGERKLWGKKKQKIYSGGLTKKGGFWGGLSCLFFFDKRACFEFGGGGFRGFLGGGPFSFRPGFNTAQSLFLRGGKKKVVIPIPFSVSIPRIRGGGSQLTNGGGENGRTWQKNFHINFPGKGGLEQQPFAKPGVLFRGASFDTGDVWGLKLALKSIVPVSFYFSFCGRTGGGAGMKPDFCVWGMGFYFRFFFSGDRLEKRAVPHFQR